MADDVRQFMVDEKSCCQFWGFEVTTTPASLALRWDGPPSVAAFFDELVERMRSDEPLTILSGLL